MPLDPDQLRACLAGLELARELDPDDPDYLRLEQAVAHLIKTAKKKRRLARNQRSRQQDRQTLRATGLAQQRGLGPQAGGHEPKTELNHERQCYVCKRPYRALHWFFHLMCLDCGDESLSKRSNAADLRGRRALVTGGRVKIGYAIALKLLRDGAEVHITTRFPKDAARRYVREPDRDQWRARLHIVGLDFRQLPVFLGQVSRWKAGPAFDILINNAAQTVWHPPQYYQSLWQGECETFEGPPWLQAASEPSPASSALAVHWSEQLFPPARTDEDGTQLDLRRDNSWVQELGEIAPVEMIEVQVVNSIAPFVLCNALKPNMLRAEVADRYIINVSAVEGQFARPQKSARHPHTNMAKAALNMLTRTSAQDYAADGIYMVAVDPGWMSFEGPQQAKENATARGFHAPLEAVDCAARLYDPIYRGIAGDPVCGVLLKDYREVSW